MDKNKYELEKIIVNRDIFTVFQPIISLRNGTVLGYEALSRVSCKSKFKNAEKLFAAAEKYGCLWELELLCRSKALEAATSFMTAPNNKKLFLNVNPNIIHDDNFKMGFTREFLGQFKIEPQNVVFEITERNIIKDIDVFNKAISHYKAQDFLIAIDDAGAGYSGLNLISEVSPDFLKIDMQLVRNINNDNIKYALVKGLVEFSKLTNAALIAEGIETYEELITLINLGVQYAQGYFIQKPEREIMDIKQSLVKLICDINYNSGKIYIDDIRKTAIKYITTYTETVQLNESVSKVFDTIRGNTQCIGFTVVEDDIPVGIITSEKLALKMSGQYGYTLYQNKPVSFVMDRCFLVVDCDTPVNVVSSIAMARQNDKLYDFIVVTNKNKYLGTVRIKDLLQKAIEIEVMSAKQQNPLTGLPGNNVIEKTLSELIKDKGKFTIAYMDIDNFKAYNDVYGFENGDMIIKLLADIMRRNLSDEQFIGHVGGDDFIVIINSINDSKYFSKIVNDFEKEVLSFYNKEDLLKGCITAPNRSGIIECFPIITLTCVCVNNENRKYFNSFEISEELATLKKIEKNRKNRLHNNSSLLSS